MRYVYIGLIVVFTALVLLFKFQNLETATVSLFSASVTLPLSILVLAIYILGMFTGGCLLALLRTWIRVSRRAACSGVAYSPVVPLVIDRLSIFHPPDQQEKSHEQLLGYFVLIFEAFIFIAYLMILFQIVADLFRDSEIGGFSKALWILVLIHEMSRDLCLMLLCGISTGSLSAISLRLPGR